MNGIVTTKSELREVLKDELPAAIKRANETNAEQTLFTKKETAEILKRPYKTICRLCSRGTIKTTSDGRYISQRAINDYLRINHPKSK